MGIVDYIIHFILAIPFIMFAVGVSKPDYDWLIPLSIFGIYPALFLGGILFFLYS